MPDYGHDLLFGTFIPPVAGQADAVVKLAELTEQLGLDLVGIQDHPYQPSFLDTWTLLSVIAARTDRLTVFPDVLNLPLRPPAVLAGSVASLDILSSGRVELGLGAGAFGDAVAAMGGARRTPAESVVALEEAIAVIRALWTPGGGVRIDGEHYRLDGARPGPFPVHPIGIWVGSYKRRMLELTGRLGDGWLPSAPYAPPEQLAEMNRIIDDAAAAAGRAPGDIRRLYNVGGSFAGSGRDSSPARAVGRRPSIDFQGPPAVWVEQLAELALTEGISGFITMTDVGRDADVRRFAEEVVPGVRELVAQERASAPAAPVSSAPSVTDVPAAASPEPVDAGGSTGLGVVPTAPPAERLSDVRLWDEAERPRGPETDERAVYTDEGRDGGRRLIAVHDHLRQELEQVRDLVRQVAAGSLDVGAARSAINAMTMRQNKWTLGTYCESYCRVVTTHHTIEDIQLFPALRQADPRLVPVVDRLAEEHEVIAEVLERVDAALVAMVGTADGEIDGVQQAVDLLTDTLLSHLSYEERELVEPLARLPLPI